MTRKNDNGPAQPSPDKVAANLKTLRVQIDKLDLQILDLANKRAGIAGQIGKVKSEQGGEVVPPTGRLGELKGPAADALGLPAGLPVIAAAADKACEVLGWSANCTK